MIIMTTIRFVDDKVEETVRETYLNSTPIIRGINGTDLVELVLKYYDQLNEKYQKMIPLKMVYIPVSREED